MTRIPREGIYYGWVLVGLLGITQTISWGILYYGFSTFMPSMESELGWSRGQMSGALSFATFVSGISAAAVGQWIDRRGPRLIMTVGSVVAVGLLVAWSQVTSIVQFYLIWTCIGLTMAMILYEPAFAVVNAWFERQRTRALTVITLMAGLASTIFMPIEIWLIDVQGWRSALLTLAVVLALSTVPPYWLWLRRRPEDLGLHIDGDSRSLPERSHVSRKAIVTVGTALRMPAFRWLAIAFSFNAVTSVAVFVHLFAYLIDNGIDTAFAASVSGMVGVMQVLGRIVLAVLGNRVSLRFVAAVVLGMKPVSLIALLLVPGPLGLFLFVIFFGASNGASTLMRPAFVAEIFGRDRYASIAGALAAVVATGTALAPISGGLAFDLLGSYEPIFWCFLVMSCVASGLVLLVRDESTESTAETANATQISVT